MNIQNTFLNLKNVVNEDKMHPWFVDLRIYFYN